MLKGVLNVLGHTKNLLDFGMQWNLSLCHPQSLSNELFSLGDAFSKSLSI